MGGFSSEFLRLLIEKKEEAEQVENLNNQTKGTQSIIILSTMRITVTKVVWIKPFII